MAFKIRNYLINTIDFYRDVTIFILLLIAIILHQFHVLNKDIDLIFVITASVIGTIPVFWNMILAIKDREWASMDMLASFALIFSMIGGEWSSAVFICLMIASARILEEYTEERTQKSIQGLLKLRPKEAKVERNGKIESLPVEQIKIGDVVVVEIGERIPVDGEIISGEGASDESSLTGESLPVDKKVGSKVSSSTLLAFGSIKIKTEKIGKDTTLEKIIALVEFAREEKPETQTLGKKFGQIYLSSVFIISLLLLFFTSNVSFVLAVVLVVCADDMAVAIPIAYLRAIGFAARIGIIIKGGKHLETLGKVDTIVFDKTGTLTKGSPVVNSIYVVEGFTQEEVLKNALIAAIRSKHPMSRAVVAYAQKQGLSEIFPDEVNILGGRGIVAQKDGKKIIFGSESFIAKNNISIPKNVVLEIEKYENSGNSLSFVTLENKIIGFVSVSDEIKKEAKSVIEHLKKLGIKRIIMLSGDNERVAESVCKQIGIEKFYANLLPEDKVARIKQIQKTSKLAMVGDGINDAASLSIANVGIAMGALGTDGAIESAEIVLMRDDLTAIPKAIMLARKVHKISLQDFGIWGITNTLGLGLVFGGLIGPAGAAAYNFISDFFPLANSIRAKLKS